jgi:hypothetical protein
LTQTKFLTKTILKTKDFIARHNIFTIWNQRVTQPKHIILGPIVSALANKYGCRFVTILGSIVAFFAFLLSTIAPSIEVLMLTYGVMGIYYSIDYI